MTAPLSLALAPFDARPIIVALAGPNGAGKTTFTATFLSAAGLRQVNPDDLGRELDLDPEEAARLARNLRDALAQQRESFLFETVFSDPVGDKVAFLQRAATTGVAVLLCFIGLDSLERSQERVAIRVMQGGHDVPDQKLEERYPRTLENLARALRSLPHVLVYDNSDLAQPFRLVAQFRDGAVASEHPPLPEWYQTARRM